MWNRRCGPRRCEYFLGRNDLDLISAIVSRVFASSLSSCSGESVLNDLSRRRNGCRLTIEWRSSLAAFFFTPHGTDRPRISLTSHLLHALDGRSTDATGTAGWHSSAASTSASILHSSGKYSFHPPALSKWDRHSGSFPFPMCLINVPHT